MVKIETVVNQYVFLLQGCFLFLSSGIFLYSIIMSLDALMCFDKLIVNLQLYLPSDVN